MPPIQPFIARHFVARDARVRFLLAQTGAVMILVVACAQAMVAATLSLLPSVEPVSYEELFAAPGADASNGDWLPNYRGRLGKQEPARVPVPLFQPATTEGEPIFPDEPPAASSC